MSDDALEARRHDGAATFVVLGQPRGEFPLARGLGVSADRGQRVEQKLLHLLANVQADGTTPLAEVLAATLPQLRRGMTLCIVT
ncbi:MAG: hypothetical protein ACLGHP_01830, partial [Vicinamibacteria bacterium]